MHHINHNNPSLLVLNIKRALCSRSCWGKRFLTCFSPPQFHQMHNVFFSAERKDTLVNDVHNSLEVSVSLIFNVAKQRVTYWEVSPWLTCIVHLPSLALMKNIYIYIKGTQKGVFLQIYNGERIFNLFWRTEKKGRGVCFIPVPTGQYSIRVSNLRRKSMIWALYSHVYLSR